MSLTGPVNTPVDILAKMLAAIGSDHLVTFFYPVGTEAGQAVTFNGALVYTYTSATYNTNQAVNITPKIQGPIRIPYEVTSLYTRRKTRGEVVFTATPGTNRFALYIETSAGNKYLVNPNTLAVQNITSHFTGNGTVIYAPDTQRYICVYVNGTGRSIKDDGTDPQSHTIVNGAFALYSMHPAQSRYMPVGGVSKIVMPVNQLADVTVEGYIYFDFTSSAYTFVDFKAGCPTTVSDGGGIMFPMEYDYTTGKYWGYMVTGTLLSPVRNIRSNTTLAAPFPNDGFALPGTDAIVLGTFQNSHGFLTRQDRYFDGSSWAVSPTGLTSSSYIIGDKVNRLFTIDVTSGPSIPCAYSSDNAASWATVSIAGYGMAKLMYSALANKFYFVKVIDGIGTIDSLIYAFNGGADTPVNSNIDSVVPGPWAAIVGAT